jgi:hypothetical protein
VERPDYSGTIGQLDKMIDEDNTFQSFKSGGTYYNATWFVKGNGKWYKIIDALGSNPYILIDWDKEYGYTYNLLVVDVEELK